MSRIVRRFQPQGSSLQARLAGTPLASFRRRAAALLIDGLLVGILLLAVGVVLRRRATITSPDADISFEVGGILVFAATILYFGVSTWLGGGSTIGKRICGIRVVSLVHEHLTLWHCIERTLGYSASSLEAGFGFLQYFKHANCANSARPHRRDDCGERAEEAEGPRLTMQVSTAPAPLFPEHTSIETERLTIRLVRASDLPALYVINGDDAVTRFLPYETWRDSAAGDTWLQRASSMYATGEAGQFVIALRDAGAIVGTCLLFRIDRTSARAEIGYVLARKYWGAGYMLEAMRAFVAFAFDRLGLRRLEATVDPRNVASARVVERIGFVKEGVLRERSVMKGEITDSSLYGLLRGEWLGARPPP